MRLRSFSLVLAGVCLLLALWAFVFRPDDSAVASDGSATSIVMIVIDTLRRDHMSLYGYSPHPARSYTARNWSLREELMQMRSISSLVKR